MGDAAEFRRAEAADWPSIWPVFAEVVRRGDSYTYAPDTSEPAARAAWLHVGEARTVTYVAILDGSVVGTALLKPNFGGLGDHIANAGWMVAPAAAGHGVGRRFAEYVIDDARSLGYTGMQFNAVVASNERALRLWRSLGFGEVGRVPGAFRHAEHGPTDLVIMFRDLR